MKRAVQLAVVVPLVVLLVWFGRQFGPQPLTRVEPESPVAAAAPELDPSIVLRQADILFGLLGSARTLAGEGCDTSSPDIYFANLEHMYRTEGYRPMAGQQQPLPMGAGASPGSYWREAAEGAETIGRNRRAETASAGDIEITAGMPTPRCGTRWKTYRYPAPAFSADAARKFLAGSPEPDTDDLPRPPGSRRLLRIPGQSGGELRAYVNETQAAPLREWYRHEMLKSWQLQEKSSGAGGGAALRDAMYFTRKGRYCLILVSAGRNMGKSTTIISTGVQ